MVFQAKTVARTEVEMVSWRLVGATKCFAIWHAQVSLVDVPDAREALDASRYFLP